MSSFYGSLCLRGQDFDSGERQEISYYPYLQFQQRYEVTSRPVSQSSCHLCVYGWWGHSQANNWSCNVGHISLVCNTLCYMLTVFQCIPVHLQHTFCTLTL